ncbi:MAG: YdcF family protein [Phormidesmis sp.]
MPPKRVPTKSPVQTPPDYSDRRSLGLLDSLSPNYPSGMSQLRIRQQSLAVGKSVFSVLIWTTFLSLATLLASLTYLRHQQQFLTPTVALVLGGAPERERYAAQFALAHPTVEIWVSSGSNPEYAQWVFDQARVPTEQWHLDYRAVDTVTNFTTLIDELDARNIDEVYLLTSDYHMRRASVIAQIVLGSRGINFKPVSIPTEQPPERPETMVREVRDGARSLLWVVTGQTGSEWKNSFQKKS